jgi:sugar-specific transcriptional regulator TrmB
VSDWDALVPQLRDIGLSGYEAKAYLALLASDSPLNGYEVAKRSGVPRSTVYETLGKLTARGAAFETRSGQGTTYVALPADGLLRRVRDRVQESLGVLEEHLRSVAQPLGTSVTYQLDGSSSVLDRAKDLIRAAEHEVRCSGWHDDLAELAGGFAEARARGVRVVVSVIARTTASVAEPIGRRRWEPAEAVGERLAQHLLVLVQDRSIALVVSRTGMSAEGVVSSEPAIVLLAGELVREEIVSEVLMAKVDATAATTALQADPDLAVLSSVALEERA